METEFRILKSLLKLRIKTIFRAELFMTKFIGFKFFKMFHRKA